MRWDRLDLVQGALRAEGEGHSLTSTNVRGLGIVLQYSSNFTPAPELLIPSVPVDKMLCGILPGCRELGISRDYDVVGPDRTPHSKLLDVFGELGLSDTAQTRLRDRPGGPGLWRRSPIDDFFALLCPFLPLQDSPITRVMLPTVWGSAPRPITPLYNWEGRAHLAKRIGDAAENWELTLKTDILEPFQVLDRLYHKEFYGRWAHMTKARPSITDPTQSKRQATTAHPSSADGRDVEKMDEAAREPRLEGFMKTVRSLPAQCFGDSKTTRHDAQQASEPQKVQIQGPHASEIQRIKKMQNAIRKVFDNTTEYFKKLRPKSNLHDAPDTLRYLDLVVAHIELANKAGEDAAYTTDGQNQELDKRPDFHPNVPNQSDFDLTNDQREYVSNCPEYRRDFNIVKIAHFYVECRGEVIKQLREKRDRRYAEELLSDAKIEEVWWILMIRGICWYLSVDCEKGAPDGLVPASLYNSQTPVWIM